jgi:CRP-like cAMP-binding protein
MRVERATKQGRVVLLALYGPGDIFGELAVLDGSVRSASAKVIETVEAQVVPAQQVTALLLAEPEVLLSLTKSIVSRLRELTDQLVQSGERSISSRVAARLVAIIDSSGYGEETNEFSLRMPISQEELGEWSGLSREATAKALRELRTLGVLSTGRQRLQVHEPDRLRAIAERGE